MCFGVANEGIMCSPVLPKVERLGGICWGGGCCCCWRWFSCWTLCWKAFWRIWESGFSCCGVLLKRFWNGLGTWSILVSKEIRFFYNSFPEIQMFSSVREISVNTFILCCRSWDFELLSSNYLLAGKSFLKWKKFLIRLGTRFEEWVGMFQGF